MMQATVQNEKPVNRRMIQAIHLFVLAVSLIGLLSRPTARAQQQQQPPVSHTFLKVGDPAPDFALRSDQGTTVKLSDYRGKKTVIAAFYVLAFTGG
jgi:cytochrome oxidase Cu insertion factor (SCO1/SenC/PrrC family)